MLWHCCSFFLLLSHAAEGEAGDLADFYKVAKSSRYDDSFYIKNYSEYAEEIDSTYYSNHQTTFDSIDLANH